ncbi:MAG: glycosyltransferase family 39 protein [Bacteroidota bacterium]
MGVLNIDEHFFKRAAVVFFISLFVVGCFVFSDYGISCDERDFSRLNGEVNYNFIKTGDSKELLACDEKYHGPAFEIFLFSAEKLFNLSDTRSIYLLRHGLNFLVFFIATIFFYLLGLKFFKTHSVALLCSAMLVLSPRIFAESFYNSKDIIMLCFCVIASYTAFLFVERQTLWYAFIHALLCGFVVDIRVMGAILPVITLYLFAMQKQKKIIPLLMFVVYTVFFTVIFWPVLWLNPIHHFMEALRQMSHFPTPGVVFYQGEFISGGKPWHYIPVWISITTPFVYIILFLVGLFFAVKSIFRDFSGTLPIQFFMFMFATPILAVVILNSTIYDSYRHIFFVYPFLLLIAVYGFTELIKVVKQKLAVTVISYSIIVSMLVISIFMIMNHPFQNVYFSFLVGKDARQKFELDYWGLSYKQALEYILATDKSGSINIAADLEECHLNFSIIPVEERKRLVWTYEPQSADYFLTNFRYHPADYNYGTPVFYIEVKKERIMEVQKVNKF